MKKKLFLSLLLCCTACQNKMSYTTPESIQLASPVVASASIFATDNNELLVHHLSAATTLEVTHLETGTQQQIAAIAPKALKKIGTYRVRAIQTPFIPGEAVEIKVLPMGKSITEIEWVTRPLPTYFKGGAAVLFDSKNAAISFHDKGWIGTNTPFTLKVALPISTRVDSITLGVLRDPASWIYPLSSVQLTYKSEGQRQEKKYKLRPAFEEKLKHEFISLKVGTTTQMLELHFQPQNLPPEHQGAGQPAWLFLDELIIY